jgi:hypothetical protein
MSEAMRWVSVGRRPAVGVGNLPASSYDERWGADALRRGRPVGIAERPQNLGTM